MEDGGWRMEDGGWLYATSFATLLESSSSKPAQKSLSLLSKCPAPLFVFVTYDAWPDFSTLPASKVLPLFLPARFLSHA